MHDFTICVNLIINNKFIKNKSIIFNIDINFNDYYKILIYCIFFA